MDCCDQVDIEAVFPDLGLITSRLVMRPVVLVFSGCYLPGVNGGGPIRTISNLVEKLGDEFDFRIVTMDRDFGDQAPYRNVKVNAWCSVGKASVFYASSEYRSLAGISRLISNTQHDVLYLNSFFNAGFTLLPMLARWLRLVPLRPVIIAPRGEFSKGALATKTWKKKPYIKLVMSLGIFKGVIWQASSNYELSDIKATICEYATSRSFVAQNFALASDLCESFDYQSVMDDNRLGKSSGALKICFLSRIAPMKNLDYVLRVLSNVKNNVRLSIYGPKESPSYWSECESLIGRLPQNITVSYCGSVDNSSVPSVIAKHDLFFVPSRGENFGHVFIEALSAGVPILVSDRTPWRHLPEKNIGWDVPLDSMDEFSRIIDMVADFDNKKWSQMRVACINYAHALSEDSVVLDMNRDLFINAINNCIVPTKN